MSGDRRLAFFLYFVVYFACRLCSKRFSLEEFTTPHLGFTWVSLGLHLGVAWVSLGFHLGSTWVSVGFHFGFTWVSLGFHFGFTWVSLGFHLGSAWVSVGFRVFAAVFSYIFENKAWKNESPSRNMQVR